MSRVAIHTLGCKLNYSESSTIVRQLESNGFSKVNFTDEADIYIINTCSVTDNADKKCRTTVKSVLKQNPEAYVVVIGCYAQLKPKEISEIPGVDMVLGAAEKFNMIEHLHSLQKEEKAIIFNKNIKETQDFIPAFSYGDRTRSFLKVQDGCDYFCSFCTIPLARGKSRNATVAETVAKATEVAATNIKEVVITGVNIGDFGADQEYAETFYDLIVELDKIEGIDRYRISSIEPNLLSNEIIDFVAASDKFVPHFHIPLQSGDDDILTKMRRKYLSDLYVERIARIKKQMPDCCIGVDVIVGFPGETEEHFMNTYSFLNELDISYLHVFPYSERNNTTAKKLPNKITKSEKTERAARLRILSQKKKRFFYESQLGKSMNVLWEEEKQGGMMQGFSENYIRFEAPYDETRVNTVERLVFDEINESGLAVSSLKEHLQ
ncbi:tRNA (N(6)-L-threonylcarbamoyladenosine(37)-C(2))-methylthiotransferase MtaB [Bacteroidia bacterium]|nr:tRNA (N(6)-L-threonylcarbamoyladenosine(37)-C(2))-methylthiotransferase MtaB [Bacteroidia bacterium]MDB9881807.1 tRNA (N(6)-L-threonylcarbamoyladenosine(37)-C(2))-methylthiotransferase MtaB [Bacteroidia bacterium]MDC1395016.1 tRNA (N(6)-L-threonylcarbamoyladenosine(37)-C(2))-methylthiotransferase MtaB [Bacteroidia bacterium]